LYTINIDHKDKGLTTYTIYRKEEADKEGLKYVYWKKADIGDYAISDDDYVAKVINRKNYPSNQIMYIYDFLGDILSSILNTLQKN